MRTWFFFPLLMLGAVSGVLLVLRGVLDPRLRLFNISFGLFVLGAMAYTGIVTGFGGATLWLYMPRTYAEDRHRLARSDIERTNQAFSVAMAQNNIGVGDFFLLHGADIDVLDDNRHTALGRALQTYGNGVHGPKDVVEYLLRHGASPNVGDLTGFTPFMSGVLWNDPGLIADMVRHGAIVNQPNGDGFTALHLAAQYHLPLMMQALLRAGANPQARNRDGQTPEDLAR